ncbi:hypothetical protein CMV_021153 [Castanea mollissima]|nr:hypothetical protein CMV_021153 [Castanea mollissima]
MALQKRPPSMYTYQRKNLFLSNWSPETGIHLKSQPNSRQEDASPNSSTPLPPNSASQYWQTASETPSSPVDGLWGTITSLKENILDK